MATTTKRDAAVHIVRTLRDAGFEAYLAGGCVRDLLLGFEPKDYDVATAAPPDAVRKLLPRSRFVGEAFGVVLVHVNRHAIEVATFRAEGDYRDGRRPSHVEFTDARGDAARRDFTINGLFEDPLTPADTPLRGANALTHGRIIDYVGGVRDLERRVVRAIGDADQRFAEDYLRMLRAVRFAARLNFRLERRTAEAIRCHAAKLTGISRERIGMEVAAMLGPGVTCTRRARAAALVQKLTLDAPTLNEPHLDVRLRTLARLPDHAAYPTALAAWMIDRHLPQRSLDAVRTLVQSKRQALVCGWRRALCLSNDQTDALSSALMALDRLLDWPALRVAARKRLMASSGYTAARQLARALINAQGVRPVLRQIADDARRLRATGVAPTPLITGDDLIRMGLKPGPAFASLLARVYDAQLEGAVTTRDQALAWVRAHA